MRLYFMRHGAAGDAAPGMSDSERKLTPEGITQVRAEASVIAKMGVKVDLILSSPHVRAIATAQIVAEALHSPNLSRTEPRLADGFRLGSLLQVIEENPGVNRIMLVGHNPDMPLLAGILIGGGAVAFDKGAIAYIETTKLEPGGGVLHWLVTPSHFLR